MDVFGGGWSNYVEKIVSGFAGISPDDVCVLCGDSSWGMSLEESTPDFRFIESLPGKKIVLKGNHDYWWSTASKMQAFFSENNIAGIQILNNNCFFYESIAICGTRGWMPDPEAEPSHNDKINAREASRLRASLQAAGKDIAKYCFFHYPPRYRDLINEEIISAMSEFGVSACWYGHIHGAAHRLAALGHIDGIEYNMVSADFVDFKPLRIL